jgi:hypothetical protein
MSDPSGMNELDGALRERLRGLRTSPPEGNFALTLAQRLDEASGEIRAVSEQSDVPRKLFTMGHRVPRGRILLMVAALSGAAAAGWGVYQTQSRGTSAPTEAVPSSSPDVRRKVAPRLGKDEPPQAVEAVVPVAEPLPVEPLHLTPMRPVRSVAPALSPAAKVELRPDSEVPSPRDPIVRLTLTPTKPAVPSAPSAPPALPVRKLDDSAGPGGGLSPDLPERSLIAPDSGSGTTGSQQGPGSRGPGERPGR